MGLFKGRAGGMVASALTLLIAAILSLQYGCGGERAEEGTRPQDGPDTAVPEGFGHSAAEGGTAGTMILRDISFDRGGDSDEVLLEFIPAQGQEPAGEVPLYRAHMGELPYLDREGNPVVIGGRFFLELVFQAGLSDPALPDSPAAYSGPEDFDLDMALLKGAALLPAEEDNALVLLVGLAERAPFRVSELPEPSRLAVEFAR